MNPAGQHVSLALLQSDPTWHAGQAIFYILIWGGLIGVALSVIVLLGIFIWEFRHKKVW